MPLKIVIADDNRDHADSLSTVLELWGHATTVAYDGRAGWEASCAAAPDCLILDIHMPGIDGYTLAGMVRRHPGLERAKLVALSAYSHPDHARRAREAGFDHQLTKPAALDQLRELLTMLESILKLTEETERVARKNAEAAARTEELARHNVELAGEARELLRDVKEGLEEVKQDVQEIKDEVKDLRDEVAQVKDRTEPDARPTG